MVVEDAGGGGVDDDDGSSAVQEENSHVDTASSSNAGAAMQQQQQQPTSDASLHSLQVLHLLQSHAHICRSPTARQQRRSDDEQIAAASTAASAPASVAASDDERISSVRGSTMLQLLQAHAPIACHAAPSAFRLQESVREYVSQLVAAAEERVLRLAATETAHALTETALDLMAVYRAPLHVNVCDAAADMAASVCTAAVEEAALVLWVEGTVASA